MKVSNEDERVQRLNAYFEFSKFIGTVGIASSVLVTALLDFLTVPTFPLVVGLGSIFCSVLISVMCALSITGHKAGKRTIWSERFIADTLFVASTGGLVIGLLLILAPAVLSA